MLLTPEIVRSCNLEGKFHIKLNGEYIDLAHCIKAQDGADGFVVMTDNPPVIAEGEIANHTLLGNVEIVLGSCQ